MARPLYRPDSITAMRIFLAFIILGIPHLVVAQDTLSDKDQLRKLHAQLIEAHIDGQLDLWMEIEADSFVSVNRGRVTYPSIAERRAIRAPYLREASFSVYRDLREPIVKISDDGSLGWVIAEVEVKGTIPNSEGNREEFQDLWAWIELYEKTPDGWHMIGNASNLR